MAHLQDLLVDFDPLSQAAGPPSPKAPLFASPTPRTSAPSAVKPSSKTHALTAIQPTTNPLEAAVNGRTTPESPSRPAAEADRRTRVRQDALLRHLSREPYATHSRPQTPLVNFENTPNSSKVSAPSLSGIGQQALDASASLWPDFAQPYANRRANGSAAGFGSTPWLDEFQDGNDLGTVTDSLPPLRLIGVKPGTRRIADERLAEEIRLHLPRRLRAASTWDLVYSLDRDGTSISTLYDRMRRYFRDTSGGCILVVQDMDGQIFGAFVSEMLRPSKEYYGNGECFLWRCRPGQLARETLVEAYHWTGQNNYMALTDLEILSVGGGDGKFGLCIDAAMETGTSARCPAFNNDVLCTHALRTESGREEGRFDVFGLEVLACS